jgi:hypothetical protein
MPQDVAAIVEVGDYAFHAVPIVSDENEVLDARSVKLANDDLVIEVGREVDDAHLMAQYAMPM